MLKNINVHFGNFLFRVNFLSLEDQFLIYFCPTTKHFKFWPFVFFPCGTHSLSLNLRKFYFRSKFVSEWYLSITINIHHLYLQHITTVTKLKANPIIRKINQTRRKKDVTRSMRSQHHFLYIAGGHILVVGSLFCFPVSRRFRFCMGKVSAFRLQKPHLSVHWSPSEFFIKKGDLSMSLWLSSHW